MIAVTGANGRLGQALVSYGCTPLYCNVKSVASIRNAINQLGLTSKDTIIHCAAITDVDACEHELYKEAILVNVYGTQKLREVFDGRIVYISTDYVFDGKKGKYSEKDEPSPINHYGFTKLLGEDVIREYNYPEDIIVRTTVLYGSKKPDFVNKVLAQLRARKKFCITTRLYGSPTYVYHLAEALMVLVNKINPYRLRGMVINISGADILSRYEFARMIADVFGYDRSLIVPEDRVDGIARRPSLAGLDVSYAKFLKLPLYSVRRGIEDYKIRTVIV